MHGVPFLSPDHRKQGVSHTVTLTEISVNNLAGTVRSRLPRAPQAERRASVGDAPAARSAG
ncbi:hypothetical protein SGA01_31970 [Streptomyces gardneri]|uniref:Uncharacterized protein n=1 Tax=Streptomyces gardneri TaxID=66892 RepID=A0A4Y3RIT3_9ACTN|nr:hypothetical protein SGA01_31970 [Streptomyces gardneri]